MLYRVVTYDRTTEQMKGSLVVPPSVLSRVKKIAGFKPRDDGLGEYPLGDEQTRQVAKILGSARSPTTFSITSNPTTHPTTAAFSRKRAARIDNNRRADERSLIRRGRQPERWRNALRFSALRLLIAISRRMG